MDDDQAALRLAAQGGAALCTIVGIEGSFSRRLGAQLAVRFQGGFAGSLADGCLENELASQAKLAQSSCKVSLIRFGRGSPFIDFRLPCGSGLDILIDPQPNLVMLRRAVDRLDRRRPAAIVLDPIGAHMMTQRRYIPRLNVSVVGEGNEAFEFARLAACFGLRVGLLTPHEILGDDRQSDRRADQWTAIVVLLHDHARELNVVEWALSTPAFYIGALGGRVVRQARRGALAECGYSDACIRRVHSPLGLIPKAREPRVLALSALSEVVAEYEALRI